MTANKHRGTDLSAIPQHEALLKGQIVLDDDTETEIVDIGELSSSTVQKIDTGYLDITLNDQGNLDLKVYVDINGALTQVGGAKNYNSDGGVDLSNFDIDQPISSSRVRLTATGNTASPATPGTIDYTIEHQTAT